ncbi:chemotaxis response regulator protein-glutamate methylesterase [Clostridia bacterium]|nr:chemotaxis response regulator protein-glutamate methylesterase [Clostridia bacterium]
MAIKKNILVVDDSALLRRYICDIINSDNLLQATDVSRDGVEAYEYLKSRKYDAMLLDVNMPRMDGLQLLEKIQQERIKITVIMVSSLTKKDSSATIKAMELGAADFITKPQNQIGGKNEQFEKSLLSILHGLLRLPALESESAQNAFVAPKGKATLLKRRGLANSKLVAIASSTGGPKSLQSVIPHLPANLDAPVLLVQHMPAGFTKSMADRLNEISKIKVKEAEEGDVLQKGWLYVAPGGYHMEVSRGVGGEHKIRLNQKPQVLGLRPYANYTYESLKTSSFDEVTCVVLTGMGADGTAGICTLGKRKPVYVITQDEASSVVYGMPKAAAEAGISDEVVPLTQVAQSITKNVGVG